MNRVLASFTRSEKSIIAFVLALIGAGYGILDYQERQREVTVFQAGQNAPAVEAAAILPAGVKPSGRIDLNTANREVLETLPGVGPAMAERILQHRTTNGPFKSVADLDAVPGIGPATLAKLSPMIELAPAQEAPAVATAQPMAAGAMAITPGQNFAAAPSAPAAVSKLVNVNTAGLEELDTLDGVGPALGRRIIQDRQVRGPYRTVESLLRVKGIGPAVLRKNRGRIVVQ